MLRTHLVIIFILFMFALTGCSGGESRNKISQMRLTDEQQQILDLVSTYSQQVFLYEFNTTEPFAEVGVRLEVYVYGELMETQLGFAMLGIDRPLEGNIAVTIIENRDDGTFDWIVTLREGGSASSSRATAIVDENMNARAFGPMNEAVDIVNSTDAAIFVSRFTSDGGLSAGSDLQSYLNPASFASYPLVHVLIASFVQ